MKLAVGKCYRTRGGAKVGPLAAGVQFDTGGPWLFEYGPNHFDASGVSCRNGNGFDNHPEDDIVEEWPGPVTTELVKRINAGTYGVVEIEGANAEGVSIWLPRNKRYSAADLRAVAAIFSELAEALEPANV